MEVYGRNSGRNGSQSDHQTQRGVPVLQESMMRMGLGSGETFPERAGVPDCVYYMRTGYCGFGGRCRYNHPCDRSAAAAAVISGGGEYPERVGEPECQFYLKTGTCKYGTSCKFHHPKHGAGFSEVPLNIYGYPVRPGETECSYYLKTGQCKFGIMCKFHHPQVVGSIPSATAPTFYSAVQSPTVPTPDQYGGPSNNWRVARPPLLPGSYVQGSYGPVMVSPGVVPIQNWNPYSAPISPALSPGPGAQPTMGTGSIYGVAQLSSSALAFARPYHPLPSTVGPSGASHKDSIFPERPGQPECQYFKKTGDCKFGSSCRYHHPREWVVPQSNSVLSPLGLPIRLGVQPCAFYLQNGQCKFGASCKFDHPVTLSYSPSASSLTDIPVVPYPYPYPLGSPLATVPLPSFSSSELRPEFISVPKMDFPSVGLILSNTAAAAELSNTAPSLSGSGSSTRQGAEIRRSS